MNGTYLTHHGIKGQKWGVRRYRNEDGSLTNAGKRRYAKQAEKDTANLVNKFGEHLDAYSDALRSEKRTYFVDKDGTNDVRSDGTRFFNPERGITRFDSRKRDKSIKTRDAYESLKRTLSKRYDEVVSTAQYDIETGKSEIRIQLSKHGETYVYEFVKDYGAYEFPDADFITYAPDGKR